MHNIRPEIYCLQLIQELSADDILWYWICKQREQTLYSFVAILKGIVVRTVNMGDNNRQRSKVSSLVDISILQNLCYVSMSTMQMPTTQRIYIECAHTSTRSPDTSSWRWSLWTSSKNDEESGLLIFIFGHMNNWPLLSMYTNNIQLFEFRELNSVHLIITCCKLQ